MMCRNWNLQRRPRGWQLRMEGSLLNLVAPWWECRWELGTGPTLGHPAGRRRVRKMTKLLWNYWRPVRPCSAIAAPTCCGWNLKNRGNKLASITRKISHHWIRRTTSQRDIYIIHHSIGAWRNARRMKLRERGPSWWENTTGGGGNYTASQTKHQWLGKAEDLVKRPSDLQTKRTRRLLHNPPVVQSTGKANKNKTNVYQISGAPLPALLPASTELTLYALSHTLAPRPSNVCGDSTLPIRRPHFHLDKNKRGRCIYLELWIVFVGQQVSCDI